MTATADLPETIIREVWPSVTASAGAASLARACYKTVVLAPIGFAVLLPVFTKRLIGAIPGLSGMSLRYRVTTKKVAIVSGSMAKAVESVSLDKIRDVRVVSDGNSVLFEAATLEILGDGGKLLLTLTGVPEPESIKNSILDAATAWGPLL